ncbi:MAG: alkaline phytoceramidase, partial [Rhizobiales bacterium]|nr:alkaline phytoceramidase [Hyphomicrobiales bacterium]
AYYHLAPGNERLVWDRLPMTIAFMALFAAFIADRIDRRIGIYWLLPLFVAAGIASVAYWAWTEALGRGDLRWYVIVQFYPIVALPIICWLFPGGRHTTGRHLAWLIAWYAVAKLLEHFDAVVLTLLGGTISGHTLKHLASGAAALVVIRMLASKDQTGAASRASAANA